MAEEAELKAIIQNDQEMLRILKIVKSLNLPDWWICAGFIRNKIWDVLHGYPSDTPLNDIDIIFFDPVDTSIETEENLNEKLHVLDSTMPWSVKNQARMHQKAGFPPFKSSQDGIAHFPELPTAIGVKLTQDGQLLIAAPWGIKELMNLIVSPTLYYQLNSQHYSIYQERLKKKDWQKTWPLLNFKDC